MRRTSLLTVHWNPAFYANTHHAEAELSSLLDLKGSSKCPADGRIWVTGSESQLVQFTASCSKSTSICCSAKSLWYMANHLHMEPLWTGNSEAPVRPLLSSRVHYLGFGLSWYSYMMPGCCSPEPTHICLEHTTNTYLWFHLWP